MTLDNKAQKLKLMKRDLAPARLDDLLPRLQTYTVTAVDLLGVATRSQYCAQESIQVMNQSVAAFIETADDSFHLPLRNSRDRRRERGGWVRVSTPFPAAN